MKLGEAVAILPDGDDAGRYQVLSDALLGDDHGRDRGNLNSRKVSAIAYLSTMAAAYKMPLISALADNYMGYSVSEKCRARDGLESVFKRVEERSESFYDSFTKERDLERVFGGGR